MPSKRAKTSSRQLSTKQAALAKKLQTMAERATTHAGLATGPTVLGIYGTGRFFDGVDEVSPAISVHAVPHTSLYERRAQFLQWVWLGVTENEQRHEVVEAKAKTEWQAKVAGHPLVIAAKRIEVEWKAFRDGTGPKPEHYRPEPEEKDYGLFLPHADEDYKAALEAEPLGTVAEACAWAVRQLASGAALHKDAGTGQHGEKRASWQEILTAWQPLSTDGIAAVAAEWGARLTWNQARKGGGRDDFPHEGQIAAWYLTRGLGRFSLKVRLRPSALPPCVRSVPPRHRDSCAQVVWSVEPPEEHALWTRGQSDVAANFAVLFGRGSGGDGGGGSSSSAAATTASSSISSSSSRSSSVSQATDQEVGRMLWQLALLQAWQAILRVAVRQLLSPRHPLHTQMDEGDLGTELFKACPARARPGRHPTHSRQRWPHPRHGSALSSLTRPSTKPWWRSRASVPQLSRCSPACPNGWPSWGQASPATASATASVTPPGAPQSCSALLCLSARFPPSYNQAQAHKGRGRPILVTAVWRASRACGHEEGTRACGGLTRAEDVRL
jgi:hypothetical protein